MDSAKRLSFEVKEALIRLKKVTQSIDPQARQIQDAILNETFNEEQFRQGRFEMDDADKKMHGGLPCVLVMNKVDIVDNKRKMRAL